MSDALVDVYVKPGSKSPGIVREGNRVIVRVRERAHEGKANDACRAALARAAGVAPSKVVLVRGTRSRLKLFWVDGVSASALAEKLTGKIG